jgi:ATP-binding cassette subfamily C protein
VSVSLENATLGSTGLMHTLSAGELQRLGIARALYSNPQILILDEPLANLDPEMELKVMGILRSYSEKNLVIYITHRHEIISKNDLVLKLAAGQII